MNESMVFPIKHGDFCSNVMLVFRGVNLDLDFLPMLHADGTPNILPNSGFSY